MAIDDFIFEPPKGSVVYALASDMGFALRLTKIAKTFHLAVRNFDRSENFLKAVEQKKPCFVIFDADGCESAAYQVLRGFSQDEELKKIPALGCVSASKRAVKDEMERAGCLRVYFKTEFFRDIQDIFMRYAK